MARAKSKKVKIDPSEYIVPDGYPVDKVIISGAKRGKIITVVTCIEGIDYDEAGKEYALDTVRELTEEEKEKYYKRTKLF